GGRDLVEGQSQRGPVELVVGRWPLQRHANVLLVHPAVECPYPHKPAITVHACRRRGRRVPVAVGHALQDLAALARYRAVPRYHAAARLTAEMAHPALIQRSDVVAHMLERLDVDVWRRW